MTVSPTASREPTLRGKTPLYRGCLRWGPATGSGRASAPKRWQPGSAPAARVSVAPYSGAAAAAATSQQPSVRTLVIAVVASAAVPSHY